MNNTIMKRRTVLKAMAAGSAGFMFGSMPVLAQSSGKLVFMEPYDMALEYIHEMNAIVGGHFEKEGLDVEIASIRNTSAAIQQVVTEQAFVGRVGLLDVFKASEAQSEPVISVGTSLHHGIFNVVSRAGDPIRTPEEFKDKLVGLASIGGGQENMLNLLLAGAGVPFDSVNRQAIGSNAGNVEILKAGRVDAFLATVESALLLKRNNEPVEIWPASKYAPLPGGVLLMTRKFAEANPETVVKFLRAMRNSALEINTEDSGKILDRITAKFDIAANEDRDFRIAAIKAYNEMSFVNGEENVMRNVPDVMTMAADLASKANIVSVQDVNSLYTNEYIDAAIKG
ncbi:ABC transporter substrate-binding protein [Mesorhizobium sp. LHD-90]|uniref:ABC transporter substrate-binding protein n=1 Tax=Mesorhizobium sp. LHD-90 TaxID=3071414 RepID=UPI0027E038C2|nr:ABC transporter substrate-binding protein [Mesorhizobium sp. LHD-90]MDQ6432524.1 ABC transporter substrate-binding protein [Mesorhizobium sp. LHD-90]